MLTEKEKEDLKSRINHSIQDYKKKRKKKRLAYFLSMVAAVVFVVLLSVCFINDFYDTTAIEKYVDNTTSIDLSKEKDVKLILNDNEEIKITEVESSIEYSTSGKQIQINDIKKVNQSEENYNTIIVPYGKQTKITLSDGTKVWLNAGSKLFYPSVFREDKREVYLTGEAIFDVSHNKEHPFYVRTKDYDIKVLGTVFNVSSYRDDAYTSTALQAGSVEIKYDSNSILGKSKTRITPGTLAQYNHASKKMITSVVDIKKYMVWRDGVFIFKNDRLDDITKKLSRYYKINVEVNNERLKNETFSGYLDLKDSIENVIEVIKETSDISYEKHRNKIIIN